MDRIVLQIMLFRDSPYREATVNHVSDGKRGSRPIDVMQRIKRSIRQ